jgi:hypothetical protein
MSEAGNPIVERRITIGIAIISALIRLPLFVLSAVLTVASLSHDDRSMGIFITSFPLTFALFFAVISWRGFASAKVIGSAISPHGWRMLAAFFFCLGVAVSFANWLGLVLPSVVASLCLLGDPKVVEFLKRIGLV